MKRICQAYKFSEEASEAKSGIKGRQAEVYLEGLITRILQENSPERTLARITFVFVLEYDIPNPQVF